MNVMKRDFDLRTWKSYKSVLDVVTEFAEPVEIVKTDCKGKYPVLGVVYDGNTDDSCFYTENGVSMSGSKILFSLDEKKYKKYKKGRISTIAFFMVFLILALASSVSHIESGGAFNVALSFVVLAIFAGAIILETIDFIKDIKILDSIAK